MDFLAKFSRLVNGMGQALVLSWTKLTKVGDVKVAAETLQALEAKVPLMLQLLIHEDDDISANIVGFCYDYLHILKQVNANIYTPPLSFTFSHMLTNTDISRINAFLFLLTELTTFFPLQLPLLTDQQKNNVEV